MGAPFLGVIYFYSYIKKEELLKKVCIPPAMPLNRKKKKMPRTVAMNSSKRKIQKIL
jgi:hypothetical protein